MLAALKYLVIFFAYCVLLSPLGNATDKAYKIDKLTKLFQWPGSHDDNRLFQNSDSTALIVTDIDGQFGIYKLNLLNSEISLLKTVPRLVEAYWFYTSPTFVKVGQTTFIDIFGKLYVTDGTIIGTLLLRDFGFEVVGGSPGSNAASYIRASYNIDNKLFISIDSVEAPFGPELWISDGTKAGTSKISDEFDSIELVFNAAGKIFVVSTEFVLNPNTGERNYQQAIYEIKPDGDRFSARLAISYSDRDINRFNFVQTGKGLFFCANSDLWRLSNGLTFDLVDRGCNRFELFAFNDQVFYVANSTLWHSTGIIGEKTKILEANEVTQVCSNEAMLFFNADDDAFYRYDSRKRTTEKLHNSRQWLWECRQDSVIIFDTLNKPRVYSLEDGAISKIRGLSDNTSIARIVSYGDTFYGIKYDNYYHVGPQRYDGDWSYGDSPPETWLIKISQSENFSYLPPVMDLIHHTE